MTDLGKEVCHPPLACRGFSESGILLPLRRLQPPLLRLCLSDEQEDESMETTGKVEPI